MHHTLQGLRGISDTRSECWALNHSFCVIQTVSGAFGLPRRTSDIQHALLGLRGISDTSSECWPGAFHVVSYTLSRTPSDSLCGISSARSECWAETEARKSPWFKRSPANLLSPVSHVSLRHRILNLCVLKWLGHARCGRPQPPQPALLPTNFRLSVQRFVLQRLGQTLCP